MIMIIILVITVIIKYEQTWGDDSQRIGLYGSEGWVTIGWLTFKTNTFHIQDKYISQSRKYISQFKKNTLLN